MKTVLVTGATGFVGRRLIRRLATQDLQLRVLVRDPERLPDWIRPRLQIVQGGLGNASAIEEAMQSVDHVLHLAALARAYARDATEFNRLNAEAVQQLLEAAARQRVRRFVHVSSVAALPPMSQARVCGLRGRPSPYALSKMVSETMVKSYVADGHDAVIVRPTRVYGPGPWNEANGATQLAAMYLKGHLRFRPADREVEANYVHVDDVAMGIELAARRGRRGAGYNLGGENASLRRYLQVVREISGVEHFLWEMPPPLLLAAAYLAKGWGRLSGRASLTPEWLFYFLEHRPIDIGAAGADLGYKPRSLRQGLEQTLNWLHRQEKGPWHVPGKQFS